MDREFRIVVGGEDGRAPPLGLYSDDRGGITTRERGSCTLASYDTRGALDGIVSGEIRPYSLSESWLGT